MSIYSTQTGLNWENNTRLRHGHHVGSAEAPTCCSARSAGRCVTVRAALTMVSSL
jgi:hypothetical protein